MLFRIWPTYQTSISICSVRLSFVTSELMNTLDTAVLMYHAQPYAILMSKTQRTNTVHAKCQINNHLFFPFSWRYNSPWVLACSTILLHASLSIPILIHFCIFIFPTSSLTSSSHLNLGLPILLTETGLHSVILFAVI